MQYPSEVKELNFSTVFSPLSVSSLDKPFDEETYITWLNGPGRLNIRTEVLSITHFDVINFVWHGPGLASQGTLRDALGEQYCPAAIKRFIKCLHFVVSSNCHGYMVPDQDGRSFNVAGPFRNDGGFGSGVGGSVLFAVLGEYGGLYGGLLYDANERSEPSNLGIFLVPVQDSSPSTPTYRRIGFGQIWNNDPDFEYTTEHPNIV